MELGLLFITVQDPFGKLPYVIRRMSGKITKHCIGLSSRLRTTRAVFLTVRVETRKYPIGGEHETFRAGAASGSAWAAQPMVGYLAWLARFSRSTAWLPEEVRYFDPRGKVINIATRLMSGLAAHVNQLA